MRLLPDGKNLGLVSDEKIWIMPLSGNLGPDFPGAPAQLNTDGIDVEYTDLSWSGDGKWIAFNDLGKKDPNQSIYIMSSSGGEPERLTSLIGKYVSSPVWSPDGTMIAYLTGKQPTRSNPTMNLIKVNTGESRVIGEVPKAHVKMELAWSPDSKRIAFN